jgi:hypothetical protein
MTTPVPPPRLLDQVAAKARMLHYSIRTEQAYIDWIRRFILFHNKKHPRVLGDPLPYLPIQFAMHSPQARLDIRSVQELPRCLSGQTATRQDRRCSLRSDEVERLGFTTCADTLTSPGSLPADHLRQASVHHLHFAERPSHNVVRLEIAMNHVVGVSVRDGAIHHAAGSSGRVCRSRNCRRTRWPVSGWQAISGRRCEPRHLAPDPARGGASLAHHRALRAALRATCGRCRIGWWSAIWVGTPCIRVLPGEAIRVYSSGVGRGLPWRHRSVKLP